MPSIAALAFNRRWKSEGTFRICTIVVDMHLSYFHRFIMSTRDGGRQSSSPCQTTPFSLSKLMLRASAITRACLAAANYLTPTKCFEDFSFSTQNSSTRSVSSLISWFIDTVHGRVYAFGSSMVISTSSVP